MKQSAKPLLLIVDVQEKLIPTQHEKQKILKQIMTMVKGFQILSYPIYYTEQYPKGLGESVDSLKKLLDASPSEKPHRFVKTSFDACLDKKFIQKIAVEKPSVIYLCGIETHICVYQTAKTLLQKKYKVEILQDSVSSRLLDSKEIALTKLITLGASLSNVEMALFECLRDAKHPHFKSIQNLIK